MANLVQCTTCQRAVWDTDVDGSGNCCFCSQIPPVTTIPNPDTNDEAA